MKKFKKFELVKILEYYFPEFNLTVKAKIEKHEEEFVYEWSHFHSSYHPSQNSAPTLADAEYRIDEYMYAFTGGYKINKGWKN